MAAASLILFTFLSQALIADIIKTQAKPFYEIGVAAAHGVLSDYPASNEYRSRTIALPYLVYRGNFLKSDNRDGTRLQILKDHNSDLDFSFGGSLPTENNKNQARLGMPNLDWTIEVGPRFIYYFYRDSEFGQVKLGLPLRLSFATDFSHTKLIGTTLAPELTFDRYHFLTYNLNLYGAVTLNYLSEGIADYFFQVEPSQTTNIRNSYDAKPGLLSLDYSVGFKYDWESYFLAAGVRYSDFSISSNKTSYLHRTDINISYVFALGFTFYESNERVPLELAL